MLLPTASYSFNTGDHASAELIRDYGENNPVEWIRKGVPGQEAVSYVGVSDPPDRTVAAADKLRGQRVWVYAYDGCTRVRFKFLYASIS